jgi:nitrogen fixation NifU-like protein
MSELSDLYQEVIFEHNKNPRNFREIAGADQNADGKNPLCGDGVAPWFVRFVTSF